jgi:hypothetical protein
MSSLTATVAVRFVTARPWVNDEGETVRWLVEIDGIDLPDVDVRVCSRGDRMVMFLPKTAPPVQPRSRVPSASFVQRSRLGEAARLTTARVSLRSGLVPAILYVDDPPVANRQHLVTPSALISMLDCLG